MKKGRLEAFSDGVLAIIITIMVLEIEAPEGYMLSDLEQLLNIFVSYVISFLFIGIYWINHHHLFQIANKVNSGILWANLNLLFWLSLLPFATDWIGESDIEEAPVMLYSCVLLLSMLSYKLLEYLIVKNEGKTSAVGTNLKKDTKGLILIVINSLAILTAFFQPVIAMLILLIMAVYWIIPSKRLEKAYHNIND